MSYGNNNKNHISPAFEADSVLELESVLSESLECSLGLQPGTASDLAAKLVKVMRIRNPGTRLYIAAPSREERYAVIRAELRPGNAADLAAQFNISVSAVYKLANRRAC
jgi:Mor family transcriptional regulator